MTDATKDHPAPHDPELAAAYVALNEELGEELQLQWAEESHAAMLRVLEEEARTGRPPLPPDYAPQPAGLGDVRVGR